MTRIALLCICLNAQFRYALHLAMRDKSRHNSKRVTLRSHRIGV